MQIFISHASADRGVAERVVKALREAGADVWYDEHNLGATQLIDEIQRQLAIRPTFIVLLSAHAFASEWVKRECKWAFNIQLRDSSHIILPVVVARLTPSDFNAMLFLEDYKRVSRGGHNPLPHAQMVTETLRLLALTPAGQEPVPVIPRSAESVDDLITQGRALVAQKRLAEALPFFQLATERDPDSADTWSELGRMFTLLKRPTDALAAIDRALAINDQYAWVWDIKGTVLGWLERHEEALVAFDRAQALARDITPV